MSEPIAGDDSTFADLIVPVLFDDTQPSTHPVVVLISAQPGAGTSLATRHAAHSWPGEQLVRITADELTAMHPDWSRNVAANPFTATAAVADQVAQWMSDALEYAKANRISVVVDGGSQETSVAMDRAEEFAAAGYTVHVVVMAVPSPVSWIRALGRFYVETAMGGPGLWTDTGRHVSAYSRVPLTTAASQVTTEVGRITVLDLAGKVLSDDSRTPDGVWPEPPDAGQQMIQTRRAVPPKDAANRWLDGHQKLLTAANARGHNSITREAFEWLGQDATWMYEVVMAPPGWMPPPAPQMQPRFGPSL